MAYLAANHAAAAATRSTPRCAASASRCASRPCRSRRTATSAADYRDLASLPIQASRPRSPMTTKYTDRPRVDQHRGRTRPPPSASRSTRRTRSATWSSSTCRRSASTLQEGRGRRRRRVGEGRGRPVHAGRRRGRRGQRGAARRPVARQHATRWATAGSSRSRSPTWPSSTQLMDQAGLRRAGEERLSRRPSRQSELQERRHARCPP